MRHTAVALWLHEGTDLYKVSTWLGHASSAFTEQVYGHLLTPYHKPSERVEKLLWPAEVVQMEARRRRGPRKLGGEG